MATIQSTVSNNIVDTAIGPVNVTITTVTNFDIDDYVQTTVQSAAIAIQMYNLATAVNTQDSLNRRVVNIAGTTVGGYT